LIGLDHGNENKSQHHLKSILEAPKGGSTSVATSMGIRTQWIGPGFDSAENHKGELRRSYKGKDKGASNRRRLNSTTRRRLNSTTVNHLPTSSANRRTVHKKPVPESSKQSNI
jgi:hypothetical protein